MLKHILLYICICIYISVYNICIYLYTKTYMVAVKHTEICIYAWSQAEELTVIEL